LAVLVLLASGRGRLRIAEDTGAGRLIAADGRVLLMIAPATVKDLLRAGHIDATRTDAGISAAGLAHMRRKLRPDHAFLAQHLPLERPRDPTSHAPAALIDAAESPLAWLRGRRDGRGLPFLDDAQFAAGERLRAEFTRAALMPAVTARWDPTGVRTTPGGQGPMLDAVLAARDAVNAALSAVGPELSGTLLDVCCFLKGLEAVEADRGWPARTARVVLGLGLTRLAAHYGVASEARGPDHAPIRHWRGVGARPRLTHTPTGDVTPPCAPGRPT
jgi:hypothetical protein